MFYNFANKKFIMYVLVTHIEGTTKDTVDQYGNYKSWIDYWTKHSIIVPPEICPCCNNFITNSNPLVGAHVKNNTDNRIYIIPCCQKCNVKYRKTRVLSPKDLQSRTFSLSEDLLVPCPSNYSNHNIL